MKIKLPHLSGIYIIENLATGKVYIGSSVTSVYQRCHIHKHHLKQNTHHSKHLQSSWNKHGGCWFTFNLLEACDPDKCLKLEQYYIDKLQAANPKYGYNIHPNARSPLGVKRSKDTKHKLSMIAKNRSPELKEKIRKASTTVESLAKISKAHKGKTLSRETRDRISKAVKEKGKEYGRKVSLALTGRKLSKEHKEAIGRGVKGKPKSNETKKRMALYASNRTKEHQEKINKSLIEAWKRRR